MDFNMTDMDDWLNDTSAIFNDSMDATTEEAMHTSTFLTTLSTTMTTTMKPLTTPKPCKPTTRPLCNPYMIAAYNFVTYGIVVNYAVGIPGAILTMILLARMRPFNSASVWLFAMSFLDFVNLTFRAVRTILLDQTGIIDWTDSYCRLYYIFSISTEHAGYMTLVGLTVERFIAVWFPLKMNAWCNRRRALIGIICIIVVCVACDLHLIETMRLGLATGFCVVRRKYRAVWEYTYMDRVQGVLLKIFPVFIVIILNTLIVVKLMRNRGIKTKMSDDQAKEKMRQQRAINRMLFAASIWFIFCISPDLVYRYTRHLWGDRYDPHVYMVKWIAMNAFPCLVLFNHSGNFILYVVAARKFRSELVKLITCGKYSLDGKSLLSKSEKKSALSSSTQVTSSG